MWNAPRYRYNAGKGTPSYNIVKVACKPQDPLAPPTSSFKPSNWSLRRTRQVLPFVMLEKHEHLLLYSSKRNTCCSHSRTNTKQALSETTPRRHKKGAWALGAPVLPIGRLRRILQNIRKVFSSSLTIRYVKYRSVVNFLSNADRYCLVVCIFSNCNKYWDKARNRIWHYMIVSPVLTL